MKTPVMLFATLAAGASLCAQSDNPRSSYSVTADFTYTSKYVFRGVQLAKDSFQPSVEVAVGDPHSGKFYGNLWTNQPIIRHENDEIDFRAGYRRQVASELSLEVLATYYWYPEARTGATRHTVEGGVGATYDAGGYAPSATVYYYYDFDRKANTVEVSLGYGIPIAAIGTSLDVSVSAGTSKADDALPDSGVTVKQSYNYYGAGLEVPYQLSQNAKLRVGAHWATNENYVLGAPRNRFWIDVGFTAGF